ncbi:MAG: GFA family protein [Paracoccaceae bacterium]
MPRFPAMTHGDAPREPVPSPLAADRARTGGCLCAAVRFATEGPLREVVFCHCTQCSRTSGHYWAATSVPLDRFRLTDARGLRWFRSSETAERGFCGGCGASLLWKPAGEAAIHIAPGAFDMPSGLVAGPHIFSADAGDYYAPEGPPPPFSGIAPGQLSCRCLCGGAAFTVAGPAGHIAACHCGQCRRLSGHYAASFDADESSLVWAARATLGEFRTPGGGLRGFCKVCGGSLWFRAADGAFSVEAGAVEGATGGRLTEHIFASDKGDWYALTDGLPQRPGA